MWAKLEKTLLLGLALAFGLSIVMAIVNVFWWTDGPMPGLTCPIDGSNWQLALGVFLALVIAAGAIVGIVNHRRGKNRSQRRQPAVDDQRGAGHIP